MKIALILMGKGVNVFIVELLLGNYPYQTIQTWSWSCRMHCLRKDFVNTQEKHKQTFHFKFLVLSKCQHAYDRKLNKMGAFLIYEISWKISSFCFQKKIMSNHDRILYALQLFRRGRQNDGASWCENR